MQPYLDLMRHVRDHGDRKDDRTGTGTLSVSATRCASTLRSGFPLLTTKKVHPSRSSTSCCGSCAGETNIAYLQGNGVTIWDEWADAHGDLGPVYGYQWRIVAGARRPHIDQIANVRRRDPAQSGLAAPHRVGVERRRHPADEAAAVPRAVPVLRRRRPALLPALPAQRRHLPWRAVQHRVVCAADPHGGAAMRPGRRATSSGPAATATSTSTTWSRSRRSLRATPFPPPGLVIRRKPPTLFDYVSRISRSSTIAAIPRSRRRSRCEYRHRQVATRPGYPHIPGERACRERGAPACAPRAERSQP